MVDERPLSRNFCKTTHREDSRVAPDFNPMDQVLKMDQCNPRFRNSTK